MRKRIEKLLWILCFAAIFAISATDPWWYEHWLRSVMILAGITTAGGIGFVVGVDHGMRLSDD